MTQENFGTYRSGSTGDGSVARVSRSKMMLPLYLSEEGDFTMRHGSSPLPVGGTAKRVFDIAFSICAILTFALPLIGIAIALKIFSRGPVIFAHERIGHDGKKFRCLKFRTMVIDAEERLEALLASDAEAAAEFAETRKLVNDPRIVPHVGTTLRKLSLDELPQLFNVLKGDMSLVGPRPVTRAEIEAHYGYRHPYMQARPGITGPWQVSGRNDLRYEDRVALDAGYVSRWSFTGDLAIILHTAVVLCRDRNGH